MSDAHRFCCLRCDISRSRSCASCCHHKAAPLLITLQRRGMLLLYELLCTDHKSAKTEVQPPSRSSSMR